MTSAASLTNLAAERQLDLLFDSDRTICIPDEILFEATEKQSWMNDVAPTPDEIYLREWVSIHQKSGRVVCLETFVGQSAMDGRKSGKLTPQNYPANLGELCADSVHQERLRKCRPP